MTPSRRHVLAGLALALAACRDETAEAGSNMKTDVETLARFIALPRRPVAVKWETRKLGTGGPIGPDDWELLALLTFDAADMAALKALSTPKGGSVDVALPAWAAPAFGRGGEATIHLDSGLLGADPFARSPLLNGFAVALDDGRSLFLVLSTS